MMPRLRFGGAPGIILALTASFVIPFTVPAEDAKPQAAKVGKLPFITFDAQRKQVRVECEALGVEAPLEFFCVRNGGSEHETVLRTPAKPSDIHTALLAVGLQPGKPLSYSEAANKWVPPQGPPLNINLEWEQDGKSVSVPAYRTMRDLKTKKEMRPTHWVYCGSRVMDDGAFAADVTGYVVSVVNFDLTLIDIPELASNSNETLEWERNPDAAPPARTKVVMVIEPVANGPGEKGKDAGAAPAKPQEKSDAGDVRPSKLNTEITDVTVDRRKMDALREHWMQAVRPHSAALREAAQAHYEVIAAMRAEQQRLIDEADRLQRSIDALEKEYQDLTTPRPAVPR
jgi:hypothetical protein